MAFQRHSVSCRAELLIPAFFQGSHTAAALPRVARPSGRAHGGAVDLNKMLKILTLKNHIKRANAFSTPCLSALVSGTFVMRESRGSSLQPHIARTGVTLNDRNPAGHWRRGAPHVLGR